MTAPELDLAAVKARIAGATEEPWAAVLHDDGRAWIDMPGVDGHAFGMHGFGPDAEFIAHARTDMPALVDRLEQAEREVERLRGVVAGVRSTVEEARQASMRGEVWVVSELGFKVLATIDGDPS